MQGFTVIFDLDGTLVDTAPDLLNTLDHLLAEAGLPPANRSAIRPMISSGARSMVTTAFRIHGRELDEAELDNLFDRFIDFYQRNISFDSKPFPGVVNVLGQFRDQGAKLGVCTNKRESLSRKLLDELGLAGYFDALAGADTFAVSKPHPDHLLKTIRLAGGDPLASVMVGDSGTDVETAKAAGVPVVAVDFGYSDKPVVEYQPDFLIGHFDELPGAVAKLAVGRS